MPSVSSIDLTQRFEVRERNHFRRRWERVSELLREVGLTSLGTALPEQFSGGQAQRVALARGWAPGPPSIELACGLPLTSNVSDERLLQGNNFST